ncbi:hypothetical protein BKA70DRAFT_1398540 [Coprinopsis sp. MPI-PUGE-AT-0042]|nr:hypothetical protein BKA70DRAFT_1398540 [Coprinopsis sp. MPI-PUGE-AT-0042]
MDDGEYLLLTGISKIGANKQSGPGVHPCRLALRSSPQFHERAQTGAQMSSSRCNIQSTKLGTFDQLQVDEDCRGCNHVGDAGSQTDAGHRCQEQTQDGDKRRFRVSLAFGTKKAGTWSTTLTTFSPPPPPPPPPSELQAKMVYRFYLALCHLSTWLHVNAIQLHSVEGWKDPGTGQNQVSVLNLPNAMYQESFQWFGSRAHKDNQGSFERAKKALLSVNNYPGKYLTHTNTDVGKLQDIVDNYAIAAETLDDKITRTGSGSNTMGEVYRGEKKALSGPKDDDKLKLKLLSKSVHKSNWSAIYDIRVDMHAKEKPVTVIYKGAITQIQERDVPITLETASPTFGVEIPSLDRWTLNIYRSVMHDTIKSARKSARSGRFGRSHKGGEASVAYDYDMRPALFDDATAAVTSKGNITATFSIPGLMTIPSDGVAHNVTIANLTLDAEMEWVSIPKREAKVHLKAIVKNVSEYTFLAGLLAYVDGSFIARTSLPLVSPDETFDCPLGLDPTIRVIYPGDQEVNPERIHDQVTRPHLHSTHHGANTNLRRRESQDHRPIPVSEDSHHDGGANGNVGSTRVVRSWKKLGVKVPAPVNVSKGITAQWEGVEEVSSESEVEDLGGEGKLGWLCSIPRRARST